MAKGPIRLSIDIVAWAFLIWTIYRKVQFYFFPYKQALVRYRRSPQSYALITGGSAGIGYGFAQNLIAYGFGVILIASRQERLDTAAKNLKAEYPNALVQTIVFDAKNPNKKAMQAALKPIIDLPITVLVNNVGGVTANPPYQTIDEYPAEDLVTTINLNSVLMAQLTSIMIPVLDRNGPSVIINIGSGASSGCPWLVLYSACKGFVESFSAAVAREAKVMGWKVDCLGIVTGEVYSEANYTAMAPGSPTSRDYAKVVLDRVEIAVDRGMWVCAPFWVHALQRSVIGSLPESVGQYLLTTGIKAKKDAYEKKM